MRSILKYSIYLLLLLPAQSLYAQQQETNIWYFGNFLGLDFNSGTAVALNDGQINTREGVATICDPNGDLLFYTDGTKIWNRLHQIMPNGTGLFGNFSSTQSAVIVPKINDPSRYYVFTVDALLGIKGLNYSVVNMTMDNGNGDVEIKNVPLTQNSVEKITAVKHCNNRDVWVLSHDTASNGYYAYLVNPSGVSTVPVISRTGVSLPGIIPPASYDSAWLGYMKASPNGKKIAAAHWNLNIDVSDFDNATGVVSNSISLYTPTDPHYLTYGVEFSPDSRLLYTTVFYTDPVSLFEKNELFQYNISSGSAAAIIASRQIISQNFDDIQTYAALQIAPDGKMYMAKNTYTNIASINNPNVYGTGCNFVANAVQWTLPGQSSTFGLPTFIQSYFYPPDSFSHLVNCPGLAVNFNYTRPSHVLSVLWNFGDPASGANNSSTQNNPVHVFTNPGVYNVYLVKFTNCGTDTIRRQVSTSSININLGPDTLVCGGTSVLLNSTATGSTNSFQWQDGSANPTFLATTAGLYWVEATNSMGCTHRDSINVNFKPIPVFNLGTDASICLTDTLTLNVNVVGATSYLWNTGAAGATIKAYQAGIYWCEVNKEGCFFRDSLTVSVQPKPIVNLGSDIVTCNTAPIVLDATNTNSTYRWQDGSINPTYAATVSGLYWVEVTNNNGCIKRDSINIAFNTVPVFNLGTDKAICQGDTVTLNATVANATSYLWNTGATSSTIKVFQAGTYWCEVNNGCLFRDSLTVTAVKPMPVVNLGNDVTVCEGVNVQLDASYPGSTYQWQDGSSTPVFTVSTPGIYSVEVTLNGCVQKDTVVIHHNLKPRFNLGPDQFICPGNTIALNPIVNPLWQLKWQDGTSASSYNITQPGNYSLTATNGCGSTLDAIIVSKGICKVFMPTGFTPDNNGRNDIFKALGTETVSQFHLKIFNRWGTIIFETKDKLRGWDGRVKGVAVASDVFIYILSYTDNNSHLPQFQKGTFLLIR